MRTAWMLVLTLSQFSWCLAAEPYPSKPVRVLASFGPGSTADFAARVISQQLSEQMGRSFVVDNRPGASGTIGYNITAKSAPDGYTLTLGEVSMAMVSGLLKSLPYDVARDFTPIMQIIRTPMALVVNPALNAGTLQELIALARANPGTYNYASVGVGTPVHMSTELFKLAAKINVVHVPYKTGGEMVTGVIGGHTQILLTTMPNVVGHVNSGKLRALAVTTDGKRSPAMPGVPSMKEAGLSSMVVYTWAGLLGPAGMPREIVGRLHAEMAKAVALPAVRNRFTTEGAEMVGGSAEEFAQLIRSELQRWAEVVKVAGITTE